MFRKIIFVFLISFLFLSCKHNQDADECDELSYRDMVVYYTACGNYIVDDEAIEEDLTDMVRWIQNGGDELIDKGDKKEIGFIIRKDSEYKEFTPSIMSKDDDSTTKDTQFFRHIVEYEDGRISECITSNDRRFGTVLFVSDPIFEKDIDEFSKTNADKILNGMLLGHIEGVTSEIDSISQDEKNNILTGKDWLSGPYYDHDIKEISGPYIQTNWSQSGFFMDYIGLLFDSSSGLEKVFGCGPTAMAQIVIHHGYWPGIDSDLMKKMKRPESPSYETIAYDYFTRQAMRKLAYDIFIQSDATPSKAGTGTGPEAMQKVFKGNGYMCKYIEGDFNTNKLLEIILEYKSPLYVGDTPHESLPEKERIGHAYIADGYLIENVYVTSQKTEKKYIHYNLGWGGEDSGWTTNNDARSSIADIERIIYDIKVKN